MASDVSYPDPNGNSKVWSESFYKREKTGFFIVEVVLVLTASLLSDSDSVICPSPDVLEVNVPQADLSSLSIV